jgi:hypothetical protein
MVFIENYEQTALTEVASLQLGLSACWQEHADILNFCLCQRIWHFVLQNSGWSADTCKACEPGHQTYIYVLFYRHVSNDIFEEMKSVEIYNYSAQ